MRLLFVSNLYPTVSSPNRGRPNARLLRRFAPEHDVRLIVARPRFLPPYADGVRRQADEALQEDAAFSPRVVHVPYAPKIGSLLNHALYARGIRRAFDAVLAERSPDAILVGWLFPDMCGVIQLAKQHGIPVFGISQGSDAHQYLDMPRRRQVILQGCADAVGIITRSQDLANRLTGAGVPTEKLRTVHNGVETDLFRLGNRAEARRELDLPADAPIVLYVGNLLPIKNPDLLFDAFAKLPANAHLIYVGEGERSDALRTRATESGLADRVRLAGLQTPAQVTAHMQAANLLVVPSRNEGIPNVIREAFACGLPVVSTDVGGIAEVIDQDWLGTLVPSDDPEAMADAINDWLGRTPDSARIRAHAEGFSWENTVAGCVDFIRERTGV